jgi:hypothetical protein
MMKKTIAFLLVLMFCAASAYAQSGNLVVNNYLGVGGVTNPAHAVDVNGDVNVSGHFLVNGNPLTTTGPPLLGAISGLRVANDVTNPNTAIDVSANYIGTVALTGTIVINCAQSGQAAGNDLDTGVLAASTWYYIWVIYNGTTVAGLASLSSTAPLLPSGYTYSRLVSAWPTNSSSQLIVGIQQGNRFLYDTYLQVASGSTNQNWTAQNCGQFIPPISTRGQFQIWLTGASGNTTTALRKNGSSSNGRPMAFCAGATYGVLTDWVDLDSNQIVQLDVTIAGSTAWYFRVLGFELNL